MGRKGRPHERGLDYFPKMVDFYEDDKIFDLLDRYGPLGVTIYDCILCIVYRDGYYSEIPLDKLSRMIVRMIGNKWVKNQKVVVQVVHFCSEIGLLDNDLMTKNIITSVGIQSRYYETAVKRMKRQLYNKEYWLLEENNEEAFKSEPLNRINSEENRISSEENQIDSEEKHIKEKESKSIYIFKSPELSKAFEEYLEDRRAKGEKLSDTQIRLLKEELCSLSEYDTERILIVKRSIKCGWKDFYPLSKKPEKKQPGKNKFNNFESRKYDMDELENQLLG